MGNCFIRPLFGCLIDCFGMCKAVYNSVWDQINHDVIKIKETLMSLKFLTDLGLFNLNFSGYIYANSQGSSSHSSVTLFFWHTGMLSQPLVLNRNV